MVRALALYYRSLRIALTLLRMDNILSRPYIIVMTYKTLIFNIKILRRLPPGVHHPLSNKQYFQGILMETTPHFNVYQSYILFLCNNNELMSYPIVKFTYKVIRLARLLCL
jgi:hypothetical protein